VLDQAGVDGVDAVKIDVEGAEVRVLQGMTEGLARGRYRRISVELHPGIRPGVAAEVIALMRAAGYSGYWVDHSPRMNRRFAYGRARVRDALSSVRGADTADGWPHQIWLAPGIAP
jgi:hypothetical protein